MSACAGRGPSRVSAPRLPLSALGRHDPHKRNPVIRAVRWTRVTKADVLLDWVDVASNAPGSPIFALAAEERRRRNDTAPFGDALGDRPDRVGGALAHRRIGGDLALDALALVAEEFPHSAQIVDHAVDFAKRRAGDALHQDADALALAQLVWLARLKGWRVADDFRPLAPAGDILADELADFTFELDVRRRVAGGLAGRRGCTHMSSPSLHAVLCGDDAPQ